jgi:3-hydroxymyristoyl/3-hydroxydecanoyl-(acyl carrier protein) dehydratase
MEEQSSASFSGLPLLKGEEVVSLIPQRAPFVMVDSFYGMDENGSYTGLTIEGSNLFFHDGIFDECGITEHIAQSGAVRIGYLCSVRKESIPVGFIGSVDKMSFYSLPKAGDELHTTLKVEQDIFNITLVSASVYIKDQLIAEGYLKIFLKRES